METWDTWIPGTYKLDAEKDVYIIYSDDENDIYDDKFDTHWEWRVSFRIFKKRRLYYLCICHSWDSLGVVEGDYPVFKHIKIHANNRTIYFG